MHNRSDALKNIRPELPVLIESTTSPEEQFQNRTLRPILKLQNDLLLQIFRHYFYKRKNQFYYLSPPKQLAYIDHCIRKDLHFKAQLLGLIIGHFTREEYQEYQKNEAELRRRITDLLVQRLQSQSDILAQP